MLFGPKLINVEFYLGRINHILKTKFVNYKELEHDGKLIQDFVKYYIKKQGRHIHPYKLGKLKKVNDLIEQLIRYSKRENLDVVRKSFSELIKNFDEYVPLGSTYLLRHPEKTKKPGRHLSFMGVKQAKEVAELIQEEILISPKPVRILIYTSEVRRTHIFAQIIEHINRVEKLDKKVEIYQEKDRRLYMGPSSEGFLTIYKKAIEEYGEEKGEFITFKNWLKREGGLEEEIKAGGIFDPDEVRKNIYSFVSGGQREVVNRNYYTIIVGISHSWILDAFLYHYFRIEELISTAEFAKVELGQIYYRGKWVNL